MAGPVVRLLKMTSKFRRVIIKNNNGDIDVLRLSIAAILLVAVFAIFIVSMISFKNDTENERTLISLCEELGGNIHIYDLEQPDLPCMLPNKTIIPQYQILKYKRQ